MRGDGASCRGGPAAGVVRGGWGPGREGVGVPAVVAVGGEQWKGGALWWRGGGVRGLRCGGSGEGDAGKGSVVAKEGRGGWWLWWQLGGWRGSGVPWWHWGAWGCPVGAMGRMRWEDPLLGGAVGGTCSGGGGEDVVGELLWWRWGEALRSPRCGGTGGLGAFVGCCSGSGEE